MLTGRNARNYRNVRSSSYPSHVLDLTIIHPTVKDKYGSDVDEDELEASEDSEDLESEDEDGEELTPAVDAAILRTLARIKKRDPAIYGKDNIFEGMHLRTCDIYWTPTSCAILRGTQENPGGAHR